VNCGVSELASVTHPTWAGAIADLPTKKAQRDSQSFSCFGIGDERTRWNSVGPNQLVSSRDYSRGRIAPVKPL
jgi:hypothetical protein